MKLTRINEIEKYLIQRKFASIPELLEKFDVSKNTIRRDIAELCKRGIASKVYGGIVLNKDKDVIPYSMRSVSNPDQKTRLGELASRFIKDGETIYVDSGTTTVNLLRFIPDDFNITIISNSLNVYNEGARFEHLNVISTGGLLYHKTNSFIGITALNSLASYHINKAFMAATGVSLASGATNHSFHEAEMKKAVTHLCDTIILMVDHTKIDRDASISFCPLESLTAFVTDERPPAEYLDFFSAKNIKCLYSE